MSSIQERVARGAAWLDEVRPGWRDAIELAELEMSTAARCVCGQVFRDTRFDAVLRMIDPAYVDYRKTPAVGIDHGFVTAIPAWDDAAGFDREYRELNAEWRRVIHASRVPAAVEAVTA